MFRNDEFDRCETDVRLNGKVVLVTGGTSGTGLEVAKKLAARGARVVITGRDRARLDRARSEVAAVAEAEADVVAKRVDFASLRSVRRFVRDTKSVEPRLDALINNVGAIGLPDRHTEDGIQLTMQVNYFAPFLLTFLLFPLLKATAPSRVVNVSSLGLLLGEVDFHRLNRIGEYSAFGQYCNAKLADVLFTVEMAKRTRGSGVDVNSMDPGLGKSDFFRNFNQTLAIRLLSSGLMKFGRNLSRVATMPVFMATHPSLRGVSGVHYRDCRPFYSSWLAEDAALTAALWDVSKNLVNITREEDWERSGPS